MKRYQYSRYKAQTFLFFIPLLGGVGVGSIGEETLER